MGWLYLFIAVIFETTWPFLMKLTAGFTRLWPSISAFACMVIDITFLSLALKTIPVGTAYAVWTGTAIMGTSSIV